MSNANTVEHYLQALYNEFQQHNLHDHIEYLNKFSPQNYQHSSTITSTYEKISLQITQSQLWAERQCGRPTKKYPWSPALHNASRDILRWCSTYIQARFGKYISHLIIDIAVPGTQLENISVTKKKLDAAMRVLKDTRNESRSLQYLHLEKLADLQSTKMQRPKQQLQQQML